MGMGTRSQYVQIRILGAVVKILRKHGTPAGERSHLSVPIVRSEGNVPAGGATALGSPGDVNPLAQVS